MISRRGRERRNVSKIVYAKTKVSGPLGGVRRARPLYIRQCVVFSFMSCNFDLTDK